MLQKMLLVHLRVFLLKSLYFLHFGFFLDHLGVFFLNVLISARIVVDIKRLFDQKLCLDILDFAKFDRMLVLDVVVAVLDSKEKLLILDHPLIEFGVDAFLQMRLDRLLLADVFFIYNLAQLVNAFEEVTRRDLGLMVSFTRMSFCSFLAQPQSLALTSC